MTRSQTAPAGSKSAPKGLFRPTAIVRAVMLKGATLGDVQYDAVALFILMLFAMSVAITRFRRTLD